MTLIDHGADPGAPHCFDPMASPLRRGMTALDHTALMTFAKEKHLILIVRDSSVYATRWIGNPGAVPKPEFLKIKTLKPPLNMALLTPLQRAAEAQLEPWYGIVSATGMGEIERSALRAQFPGLQILAKCDGEAITIDSKLIYSDIDIHGVYDLAGNSVDSMHVGELLNGMMSDIFFKHRAQDVFESRNDPAGGSFGPQPPVTAYMPDGALVHLTSMAQMQAFYVAHRLPWKTIYPLPLATYREVSGRP
ncbi:MAG: hypothetical protein ABI645_08005 [Pseudomonadota bacterium]